VSRTLVAQDTVASPAARVPLAAASPFISVRRSHKVAGKGDRWSGP